MAKAPETPGKPAPAPPAKDAKPAGVAAATPKPAAGAAPGAPAKNGKTAPPAPEAGKEKAAEDAQPIQDPPKEVTEPLPRPPSRLFQALSRIAFIALLGILGVVSLTTLVALDFLDVIPLRWKIPESMRTRWPLAKYYDFVKMNQLPSEQRYEELIQREKRSYDELMAAGSADLKRRADELESSYRELIRKQEMINQTSLASQTMFQTTLVASQESAYRELMRAQDANYRKRQQELLAIQEDNIKESKRLEELKKDLDLRKESVDILTKQVSAEAVNLESSLIRFMEEENRLKPIQEVSASMDPRSLAQILDEVSDNKLIYDILRGVPPERSALILSFMDPEKAGKIVKMSTLPQTLPAGNRPYIPSNLQNLVASAQNTLR
ncbi:MAG: hypothetical protein HQM09_11550 [Candidatus Riflebacteria bacterium]|nr:hypothetical protein [Candidatus Riflebacteria bacterium]